MLKKEVKNAFGITLWPVLLKLEAEDALFLTLGGADEKLDNQRAQKGALENVYAGTNTSRIRRI